MNTAYFHPGEIYVETFGAETRILISDRAPIVIRGTGKYKTFLILALGNPSGILAHEWDGQYFGVAGVAYSTLFKHLDRLKEDFGLHEKVGYATTEPETNQRFVTLSWENLSVGVDLHEFRFLIWHWYQLNKHQLRAGRRLDLLRLALHLFGKGEWLATVSSEVQTEFDEWIETWRVTILKEASWAMQALIYNDIQQGDLDGALEDAKQWQFWDGSAISLLYRVWIHGLLGRDKQAKAILRRYETKFGITQEALLPDLEQLQKLLLTPLEKRSNVNTQLHGHFAEDSPELCLTDKSPALSITSKRFLAPEREPPEYEAIQVYRLTQPSDIPALPEYFIEREAISSAIDQALQKHRRANLHGQSGTGKTTLALEYAKRFASATSGPILFVELTNADINLFRQAVAEEAVEDTNTSVLGRYQSVLNDISLLVLDNAWNEQTVETIRNEAPDGLLILATSLTKLDLFKSVPVMPFSPDQALDLVNKITMNEYKDDPAIEKLCESLKYNPRALDYMGRHLDRYVETETPSDLLQRIDEHPRIYQPIQRMFDITLEQFTADEKKLVRAFGDLWVPYTTEYLLAAYLGMSPGDVKEILEGKPLRTRLIKKTDQLYRVGDVEFLYLQAQRATLQREKMIRACYQLLKQPQFRADKVHLERGNILSAIRFAQDELSFPDLAREMLGLMIMNKRYFRSHWIDQQMLGVLEQNTIEPLEQIHHMWAALGDLYGRRNQIESALHAYKSALMLAQIVKNDYRETMMHIQIGRHLYADDIVALRLYYKECLQNTEEPALISALLQHWGNMEIRLSRGPEASEGLQRGYECLGQALALIDPLPKNLPPGMTMTQLQNQYLATLHSYGTCETDMRRFEAARHSHQRVLELAQKFGNRYFEGNAHQLLAEDELGLNRKEAAQHHACNALNIFRELQSERNIKAVENFLKQNEIDAHICG